MGDRRRVNGPGGQTLPPHYVESQSAPIFRRKDDAACRAIYLKTGVTPSASGSAYLEMESRHGSSKLGLKLTCTVHGPRSLPRSAPFSPHMLLSTYVKFAPFATRHRKGFVRDSHEQDLSAHLATALHGAVAAHRWPKSGVDVIVTIIEGELEQHDAADPALRELDLMNILSGCINVAAAAVADAGIDCVDTVAGGVAALVEGEDEQGEDHIILDPLPSSKDTVLATCCVAYLPTRDEIVNLWFNGHSHSSSSSEYRELILRAIVASKGASKAVSGSLIEALKIT